jgi:hypothetical protein
MITRNMKTQLIKNVKMCDKLIQVEKVLNEALNTMADQDISNWKIFLFVSDFRITLFKELEQESDPETILKLTAAISKTGKYLKKLKDVYG